MALLAPKFGPQRGVAALEFALVVPLFLMLLGGTIYFGIALFAKIVVTNAANVAVRACVAKQVGFQDDGAFTSCATSEMASITSSNGTFSNLCMGGSGQAAAKTSPVAVGALAQDVKLLVLTVPCNISVNGMINGAGAYGAGANITQFNMQIVTSMPYTLYKPN